MTRLMLLVLECLMRSHNSSVLRRDWAAAKQKEIII